MVDGNDRWPASPTFASAVEGAVWPALPSANGMALGALLLQFAHSQWWPAGRIAAAQSRQLGRLIDHARRTVPYYRDRLPNGIDDRSAADSALWREIPILTRRDIQVQGDALLSTDVPAGHGALSEVHTSGSTGRPVRGVRTQLNELFWSAFTLRDHLWHRRDLSATLAAIRESAPGKAPYPDGSRADRWGVASAALFETGQCVNLNIMTPLDDQLDWLRRMQPAYLLSHPTNIERLARRSVELGLELSALREVLTIAEALPARIRAAVAEAWHVAVADIYSAREVGYMALQCPEADHYHVQAEGVLLEVIDDRGDPCPTGTIGRVIVTPLHNFAMPLLRYEIGDMAEVGAPCACGRGLPVLQRIVGRRQNMLVMPDGELRWPLLSSNDIGRLSALAPVRQYQFLQRDTDLIEFRLAVARPLTSAEEHSLTAWLHAKFGYPFTVTFQYFDEIPREPSGKFTDFVCAIDTASTGS